MKNLIGFALFVAAFFAATPIANAQQDPTFTKYIFNGLIYNPAVAGSEDYMVITALHRQQWAGVDGGPQTTSLTVHSPVFSKKVALGLTIFKDAIGPTDQISVTTSYAYRVKIGQGKMAIGMSAGVLNWRSNWTKLIAKDAADPAFTNEPQPNYWLPNFGAGVLYKHPSFFAGFSIPHILEFDLGDKGITNNMIARQYRHYLVTAGTNFYINPRLQFKPYIVLKSVGWFEKQQPNSVNAPSTLDIDLSLLFSERTQVGVAYRTAVASTTKMSNGDSFDVWATYKLQNGLKFGASYDYPLSTIGRAGGGAFQVLEIGRASCRERV